MKILGRLLLCAVVATVSTAATSGLLPHRLTGKRIAGQVVDAQTGQPIAGAHVAYIWRSGIIPSGFTAHNSRDICYHAAAAITDSQGRFDIPPWAKWSTYDVYEVDPIVLVYARKYERIAKHLESTNHRRPEDHLEERYAMKPFSGTVDQRMQMLFFGLANQGCDYGGESQKSLYPMLKAIYGEGESIARTPGQLGMARSLAVQAAYAALAFDPNGPARDAELNAFIQDNLK